MLILFWCILNIFFKKNIIQTNTSKHETWNKKIQLFRPRVEKRIEVKNEPKIEKETTERLYNGKGQAIFLHNY